MIFTVFFPLIIAIVIPFLNRFKKRIHTGVFALVVPLGIFLYFIRFIGEDFQPVSQQVPWIPSLNIMLDFYLDGLSLLFVLLISGIGALVTLYSIYYLHKNEKLGHFYVYLLMFMSAMLGVVLSDNVFVLYSFWELTSISSFLLIGYWNHRERSRYGALKSLLVTVFGGLSMFAGLILLSIITETTSIQEMVLQKEMLLNNDYFPLIMTFLLLGAFTKSAQFPFHIWLPDAMEAPTPVSAYLHSATMVKAGIFLVARFSPILSGSEWFFIVVSIVGIITLCWGSYMAVRQTDLKAILAFSTISQLGMIMAMLGFGTEVAVFAAAFHILNHATFKGSLFMVAGIVDHETGSRDIRKLGGLFTFLPITATLALFGTFSMAGVPLPFLNGFYSKEMFFDSALNLTEGSLTLTTFLRNVIPYLAVFGSIFTFVYSMYLFFGTFTGKGDIGSLPKRPHEAPVGMLVPPAILVVGIILIGLFPNMVNQPFLAHAAEAISGMKLEEKIAFWHGITPPFRMSLTVVGIGTLLFVFRNKWKGIYHAIPGPLSLNRVYDWLLEKTESYSSRMTKGYMNGSISRYVALILTTILLVTFTFMGFTEGFVMDTSNLAEVSTLEISIAIVMIVAAFGTIFSNNNIAAIIILGVVGYGISTLFVIYRAPDLALTQLIVETVTVALFLLCFYHLPKLRKNVDSKRTKIINSAIAISFGTLMTMVAISSHSSKWFEPISEYFIETSEELAGGDNVVNVILVDMRGLDTLFEITVLGIAALGIYGLIRLRNKKEENE
ncbi:Na+/H+ antiporter subunit A [Aquibacillus sp. 3ASR75-11]|uniref:Na+/H+ antiporter subunit A n=1 Tax=Terrihalobacillus insolitus TaxID=2950438 RepID=A0A9X3WSG0_9BACI|nr:Na+/H+ antiporter subunit A [Terrihalobacillus insolitus]MDC3413312.1 Na+/H+ antiporter subunit A [Terrihalobacillus insolitus]MDC3424895.1 Na+/H+ antiporter subunit A [Terrihalobacillus insolitus]